MKKKVVGVLLAVLMVVTMAGLVGCGGAKTSKIELTYGKKYISSQYVKSDNEHYYIFNSDGTGVYRYNNVLENSYRWDYTLKFKYILIEETVVCFYDSVEYGKNHNNEMTKNESTFARTLGFSQDILMSTSGAIFICEDYLKNIPNFG